MAELNNICLCYDSLSSDEHTRGLTSETESMSPQMIFISVSQNASPVNSI